MRSILTLEGFMVRSFFPLPLVLLLAPALAQASVGEKPAAHHASAQSGDHADRSARRASGGKTSAKKKGSSSSDSDSKGSDSKGSDSRDSGGARGGDRGRDDAPYGPQPGGGTPPARSSGSDDRSSSRPDNRQPASAAPSARPDSSGSAPDRGRDGIGNRPTVRPGAEHDGSERDGADGRGDRSANPAGSFDGARPTAAPVTRPVNMGVPGSASRQPGTPASATRSAAPANFRSSSPRAAAAAHADASREHHERADGRESSRSDADRAYRSEARHAEAERHARSTAAYHRREASWRHHTAAVRHHSWAAWHSRAYHHWWAPGGWFRPYRPGYPAYWYHGVFVYGPGPWYYRRPAVVVVDGDGNDGGRDGGEHENAGPVRKVDRARTFAIGVRGGSYMGAYDFGGGGFGDAGLGLAARYRPTEAVGLELSWMHHDQTWDTGSERVYQPLQASVELFAFPWSKVNPYVLAGVTVASRQVHDDVGFTQVDEANALWGPHAGVGIEFGVGKKASINFDFRYAGYLNKPQDDLTVPGAFQGNMGLNFYF